QFAEIQRCNFRYDECLDPHAHPGPLAAGGGTSAQTPTAAAQPSGALDVRMYLRSEVREILAYLIALRGVFADLAATSTLDPAGLDPSAAGQPRPAGAHHWLARRDVHRTSDGKEISDASRLPLGGPWGTHPRRANGQCWIFRGSAKHGHGRGGIRAA
ncbi:MAG: hypothetical protein U5J82_00305, partial [Desulfobacterales bacterium]|nr:hypothetical protein [Desulfobacterales bacterium]